MSLKKTENLLEDQFGTVIGTASSLKEAKLLLLITHGLYGGGGDRTMQVHVYYIKVANLLVLSSALHQASRRQSCWTKDTKRSKNRETCVFVCFLLVYILHYRTTLSCTLYSFHLELTVPSNIYSHLHVSTLSPGLKLWRHIHIVPNAARRYTRRDVHLGLREEDLML